VWWVAAAKSDGYRRAYGLDHDRPGGACWCSVAQDGRAAALAMTPTAERTARQ
jgi:hypothetical protein